MLTQIWDMLKKDNYLNLRTKKIMTTYLNCHYFLNFKLIFI